MWEPGPRHTVEGNFGGTVDGTEEQGQGEFAW